MKCLEQRTKSALTQAINGGRQPGAVGPTGVQEKNIALAVSRLLREMLITPPDKAPRQAQVAVTLTRDSDIDVALTARADMANAWRADAFVSIHCNAAVNRQAHGFEVFTSPGQNRSDVLAEEIIKAVALAFPALRIRRDMTDGDSDKEARFTVLTRARIPAVLVEMAFISNPAEERMLASVDFQQRMAGAIATGILRFLGVRIRSSEDVQSTTKTTETASVTRKTHTVIAGDTVWGLSRRYNVTPAQIRQWNRLQNDTIRPGQALIVS